MEKILIFLENGVEDVEFIYPYYRFQEEGYEVVIAAPKAKEGYNGKHGLSFTSDTSPEEVKMEEFVALIIPGGQAPDRMRINKGLIDIVKAAFEMNMVVAAVCHGPQMLIEADVVSGRKVTSWPSVRTDLRNAGAEVVDESAVVDGNLVTSRSPDDLPAFCKETIKLLKKRESRG
ncbi:MAG: protease [Thermoproteota archaeon]|nr:protease [Thermoproteota archaeon]